MIESANSLDWKIDGPKASPFESYSIVFWWDASLPRLGSSTRKRPLYLLYRIRITNPSSKSTWHTLILHSLCGIASIQESTSGWNIDFWHRKVLNLRYSLKVVVKKTWTWSKRAKNVHWHNTFCWLLPCCQLPRGQFLSSPPYATHVLLPSH